MLDSCFRSFPNDVYFQGALFLTEVPVPVNRSPALESSRLSAAPADFIAVKLTPVGLSGALQKILPRGAFVMNAVSTLFIPALSSWRKVPFLLVAGLLFPAFPVIAQEPLRQLVNRELAAPAGLQIPASTDAEFLRRAALDLTGMPPSADEARAFLTDTDPGKREKLIDRLLQSPQHHRHLAASLDVMLMERRSNQHVSQDEWMAWLLSSVRSNKPWNKLVLELLTADGEPGANRPAARFLLDRAAEPHTVARDVGRMFFGKDLQCAQCHDSPIVADFLQQDYQGLLAVSTATYPVVRKIEGKDVTVLGERTGGDLTFESVFIKGTAHRTGPRLPGMAARIEPFMIPGEEYQIAPADGVRAVPKVSRRIWLAQSATDGSNTAFNENAANRLWSMMFGRGLTHPLDMLHADNPAVHPQLLQQLGRHFADSGFDIRSFLRELVLSEPWQRPFDFPEKLQQQLAAARAEVERLAAEKVVLDAASREAAAARDAADAAYAAAEAALIPLAAERDKLRGSSSEALKKLDEAKAAANTATAALKARQTPTAALQAAAESAARAAAALPDDAQLATAAKTLAAKAQTAAAELPALQKTADEKAAAVAAPEEVFRNAVTALTTAHQNTAAPLQALNAAENQAVAARQKYHLAQLHAVSVDARLKHLQKLADHDRSQQTLTAAVQQVASRQAELTTARQQLQEQQPVAEAAARARQSAEQQLAAAQTTMTQATQLEQQSSKVTAALTAATASLGRAAAILEPTASLTSTATALASRSTAAAAASQSARATAAAAATGLQTATTAMQTATSLATAADTELLRRRTLVAAAETAFTAAQTEFTTAESRHRELDAALPADLATRFELASLKPLTPEQLCWTVFKVTTVYDRYRAGELAEMDKASPLTDEQKQNPTAIAEREQQIEQRTWDKLKSNIGAYAALYGGAPGQPQTDFYASADQALFTANGGSINSWIAPAGGNATERIIKATAPELAAEELYLGILTRLPTAEESADVAAFLASRPDRSKAAMELVWGLISSAEFRFNH